MSDLEDPVWAEWIRRACAAVDVDPAHVDVTGIHALTKEVANRLQRPMAPVSSFILGLAVASHPTASPADLRAALEATLPPEDPADG